MITVHHLDYSRSTRVLWLLEELGIEYELVRYPRGVGAPAPAELKKVHPLGTSPVIEDGNLVLAESSAILRYIDRTYGGASRFTPHDQAQRARHDEWMDSVEASIALPVIVLLIGGRELPGRMADGMQATLDKNLQHVARALLPGPYLMGEQLTLADMQMSYILAVAGSAGLLVRHPEVERYLQALIATPGLQRAILRGGPMTA